MNDTREFHPHHHHDHPRRDRRRGPDAWDAWAFGPGFGPGFGGPRRGRRPGRRGGDVRAAVLLLLAEEPRHGYQLIQDIGERSHGAWNPSPGSVYPVLQQLEDEGLIVIESVDGRKTASLTDEGRAHVEQHADQIGNPWEQARSGVDPDDLRTTGASIKALFQALRQVMETGTPRQRDEAVAIIDDARRRLYGILAATDES